MRISIRCIQEHVRMYLRRCTSTWIHIAGTNVWVSSLFSWANLVYTICTCVLLCVHVCACWYIFAWCLVVKRNIIIRILRLRNRYLHHTALVIAVIYHFPIWYYYTPMCERKPTLFHDQTGRAIAPWRLCRSHWCCVLTTDCFCHNAYRPIFLGCNDMTETVICKYPDAYMRLAF